MKTYVKLATSLGLIALIGCNEGKVNSSETEVNATIEEMDSKMSTPTSITEAFQKKFKNFSDVVWSKELDDEWEAEFKIAGNDYAANFDAAGNWLETEKVIKFDDVPQIVKDILKKEFVGYKVDETEISETPQGMVYEFELDSETENLEREVAISPEGKITKNELLDSDESDENNDHGEADDDNDGDDDEDDGDNDPENN